MPVLPAPTTHTHALEHARFTSLATPSLGASEVSVWRVELAPGALGVTHQLTRGEVFVVESGRVTVVLGETSSEAVAGDTIVVPPDTDFALGAAGDEPAVALCVLPAGGQAKLAGESPFTPPWAL
jgi:quercetin dioxygenase-like cupin family protein